MPQPGSSRRRFRIERDLVEADLDAAFALLYLAETQSMAGARDEACRALEEADAACSDGQRRLRVIGSAEDRRIRLQLERMRQLIDGMQSRLKAA